VTKQADFKGQTMTGITVEIIPNNNVPQVSSLVIKGCYESRGKYATFYRGLN